MVVLWQESTVEDLDCCSIEVVPRVPNYFMKKSLEFKDKIKSLH